MAPTGTTAVTDVAELTVTLTAFVALNMTAAPHRFVPEMVTLVPTGPLTGRNDAIVGAVAARTVKLSPAVFAFATPLETLKLPAPVVAAQGSSP